MMKGFLQPVDDKCIDCGEDVYIHTRNYIVMNHETQQWKRQCAKCHDKAATAISSSLAAVDMPMREDQ